MQIVENRVWDRVFTENYWGMAISDANSHEFLKMNPVYAAMLANARL